MGLNFVGGLPVAKRTTEVAKVRVSAMLPETLKKTPNEQSEKQGISMSLLVKKSLEKTFPSRPAGPRRNEGALGGDRNGAATPRLGLESGVVFVRASGWGRPRHRNRLP